MTSGSFDDTICRYPGCGESGGLKRGHCDVHRPAADQRRYGAGSAANLTDAQKVDIRRRVSRFERPIDIAHLYGITAKAVRAVMKKAS